MIPNVTKDDAGVETDDRSSPRSSADVLEHAGDLTNVAADVTGMVRSGSATARDSVAGLLG